MKALQVRRSVGRLGLARVASALAPAAAVRVGPLEYADVDHPELPGPAGTGCTPRLAGICGSDLSMIEGHASTYFDDWVSFPFVPGHEVVGELDDGTRVVLEPVLGHEARGFRPPFDGAAPGDGDDYAHLATGHLDAGIQTGFCCSTGGGWSPRVRRPRQPAAPHRRRRPRRAGRARRAARRRHPRRRSRPATVAADEPVDRRARRRHDGPRRRRRARPLRAAGDRRRRRPLPAPAARGPPPRRPRGRAGRRAGAGRAADRRLPRRRRPPVVRCPRHDRRRRQRALDHRRPRHHPTPRPRRDDGHAGRGHRSTSPGCGTARPSSSAPTRTAPSATAARRSTSPWRPPTPSRPSAGSRPPTPSPTTSTPSPTPPTPAGAAPSRSPSTCVGGPDR